MCCFVNVLFPQTSHSHTGLLVDGTSFHSHKLPFQTKAGCRFSPASRCKFSLCAEICAQESWHRTLTHHAHAHHHAGIGCVHSLVPLSLVVWSAVICFPWLTVYASEHILSTPFCIKLHISAFCIYPTKQIG